MFWSKLCKSSWNCAWNLAFPVFISPIVWNMCENLPYESVYFKELHNEQECYWPTTYRAGAAVVSTIISCKSFSCVFRICTRAISILSILAFLMTVDPRNKLRWSYYRCKWVKSRFSRCNWDARGISKEMHESSTTVCTATGVTDSPAQRYRRHLLMKTSKTRSIPCSRWQNDCRQDKHKQGLSKSWYS